MIEKYQKQIGIIPLFATPAVITNIDRDFTKEEIDCIADILMYKDVEQGMFNHRSKDTFLFDNFADKELKDIKNFCEQQLKIYLEEIEGVDTELVSLRITQSWLNKTKPGESHHSHFHANSYISGVFYISCLLGDHINFSNRTHGTEQNMEFPKKKATVWNSVSIAQNVREGDLIIFPSWMIHHVDLNETKNKERISLSFNTFPIGEMGNSPATHLKL